MKLFRHIEGVDFSEVSSSNAKSYENKVGRAKHNRRAKLQHITDAKPLEFLAIAKREAFKEARREERREERRAKRK